MLEERPATPCCRDDSCLRRALLTRPSSAAAPILVRASLPTAATPSCNPPSACQARRLLKAPSALPTPPSPAPLSPVVAPDADATFPSPCSSFSSSSPSLSPSSPQPQGGLLSPLARAVAHRSCVTKAASWSLQAAVRVVSSTALPPRHPTCGSPSLLRRDPLPPGTSPTPPSPWPSR